MWQNEPLTGCRRGRPTGRDAADAMPRTQRRRSFVESRLGMNEDFSSRGEPADTAAPAPAASEPDYVNGLERLAQLGDQGILTDDEFEAKKKQIIGIQNARSTPTRAPSGRSLVRRPSTRDTSAKERSKPCAAG